MVRKKKSVNAKIPNSEIIIKKTNSKKTKKSNDQNLLDRFHLEKNIRILIRYLVLLIIMILSFNWLYQILKPATVYSVIAILKLFFNNVMLANNMIIIDYFTIVEIIPACVSISAYLLLIVINMTVFMSLKKRAYTLAFSLIALLVLNILRIIVLIILYYNNFMFFDLTHKMFWFVFSTLFVVLIWFLTIKIFKIREIPIYSDINYLVSNIKRRN